MNEHSISADVIYAGAEAEAAFRGRFACIIKDASDMVHDERFEVCFDPAVPYTEYFRWLITEGWAMVSLHTRFCLMVGGPQGEILRTVIQELQAEKFLVEKPEA